MRAGVALEVGGIDQSEYFLVFEDISDTVEQQRVRDRQADAQIAAICRSTGSRLATRNVKDFADTGVEVVNPWDEI